MPKPPDMSGLRERLLGRRNDDDQHPVDTFTDDADAGRVVNVPVEAITPNPNQPRKHFDPQALDELAKSIARYGVLQPIIVEPQGEGFMLIAGERRWRATKIAELAKIPAVVRSPRGDADEIALIENLQRERLNAIEESEGLLRLKEQRGLRDDQVAEIIGKSRGSVTESLSLNRLPEAIRSECRTSDMHTKSQLLQVLRESDPEAQQALWQAMKAGNLTVRQARARKNGSKKSSRPKPFQHEYLGENGSFTVRVTFRKSDVDDDEVRFALEEALKFFA
jgi:ParB family chromosome partitioning protein